MPLGCCVSDLLNVPLKMLFAGITRLEVLACDCNVTLYISGLHPIDFNRISSLTWTLNDKQAIEEELLIILWTAELTSSRKVIQDQKQVESLYSSAYYPILLVLRLLLLLVPLLFQENDLLVVNPLILLWIKLQVISLFSSRDDSDSVNTRTFREVKKSFP